MKRKLAILSVTLFANQVSADNIKVGDVFYCTEDKVFLVTSAPNAYIREDKPTAFKFKINDGNVTIGNEGKLADTVFDIDQPIYRALQNGHYTDVIFAKDSEGINLMLSSQEDSSLKLMYTIFDLRGRIMGITASCDKF